jgi:hypothetical protein
MSIGSKATAFLVNGKFEDKLILGVIVNNHSGHPANLGYENISIVDDAGRHVALIDADKRLSRARTKAIVGKIIVGLSAGISAAANEQLSRSSWSASASTPYGLYSESGTYRDAALAAALNEQTLERAEIQSARIDEKLQADLAGIDKLTLQTTTVDDGGSERGLVWFERPQIGSGVHRLFVDVNFAGEEHHFVFHVASDGSAMPSEDIPAFSQEAMRSAMASLSGPPSPSGLPQPAQPASFYPVAAPPSDQTASGYWTGPSTEQPDPYARTTEIRVLPQ